MPKLDQGENTVNKTEGWIAPDGADPFNHYITFYYENSDRSTTVPIITHVRGNLWHGGYVENLHLGDNFDLVVSLYPWGRYKTTAGTILQEYRLYDGPNVNVEAVEEASDMVKAALDLNLDVLVHCQAGMNRSSLVVVRTLMKQGMTARDAIHLLRKNRHEEVLFNKEFEAWLISLDT